MACARDGSGAGGFSASAPGIRVRPVERARNWAATFDFDPCRSGPNRRFGRAAVFRPLAMSGRQPAPKVQRVRTPPCHRPAGQTSGGRVRFWVRIAVALAIFSIAECGIFRSDFYAGNNRTGFIGRHRRHVPSSRGQPPWRPAATRCSRSVTRAWDLSHAWPTNSRAKPVTRSRASPRGFVPQRIWYYMLRETESRADPRTARSIGVEVTRMRIGGLCQSHPRHQLPGSTVAPLGYL